MGWTYTARARGTSNEEWFKQQWGEAFAKRVVATASKNGVFYAVLESPDERLVPDAEGKTYCCIVALIRWCKDAYNFGYKDMDEFMGPCEAGCPERLLKMLSPIKDGIETSARDWRARCWAAVEKSKKAVKLVDGMKVKLPAPVKFMNGSQLDTFIVRKYGRKAVFVGEDGGRYRLPKRLAQELQVMA